MNEPLALRSRSRVTHSAVLRLLLPDSFLLISSKHTAEVHQNCESRVEFLLSFRTVRGLRTPIPEGGAKPDVRHARPWLDHNDAG